LSRRTKHHLGLAGLNGACLAVAAVSGSAAGLPDRFSIVTAYLCLGLLCTGLAIGPIRAIGNGRPTVNNYLRRDIGIWAGLTGLAHLVIATALSMSPEYMGAFVTIANTPLSEAVRTALFTWGTIAGLVVGVLLLILLAVSNDKTLQWLGIRWWKRVHRLSYLAFALTAAHGLAFQALESRAGSLIALVVLGTLAIFVLQMTGVRRVRNSAQRNAGNTR
jgi:sulfoxide reductase heme-binding subunit YedZ